MTSYVGFGRCEATIWCSCRTTLGRMWSLVMQSAGRTGRAQTYDVLEREERFFAISSVAALLPEDTGLECAGDAMGVSGSVVGITCLCGVVASGALLVGAALLACSSSNEGEGVWRRRNEPTMERGIWARKETLLVGDEGAFGGEASWPCLRAASAVRSMSSIVPATGRGRTCCKGY